MLTTVTADGVTQRAVHRWREDRAGKPVRPQGEARRRGREVDDASPFASAAAARTLSFWTGADLPMWAHDRR